jgi:hypothetical protein
MGVKLGKSWWYSDFRNATFEVQIGISATDWSTSHWLIIYDNRTVRNAVDRAKKEQATKVL